MTQVYAGERYFGLELARMQGYIWDMPNIMRGDVDTGERVLGNDYNQDMMLWALPAALAGQYASRPR